MTDLFEYIWYILENYGLLTVIMITIIEVLMYLLKWPIKFFTNKIPNELVRKIVNKSLIILAFALSIAVYALGHLWLPSLVPFAPGKVIMTGAFTVVLYAFVDGVIPKLDIFKKIEKKAKETSDAVEPVIEEIKNDEKPSKEKVKSAVDSFHDLLKTTNSELKKSKKK